MEPAPPTVQALIPKHQNTREVPPQSSLCNLLPWSLVLVGFLVGVRGDFTIKYIAQTSLLLWCSRKMQSRWNINLNTVLPGRRKMRTQPGHEVAGKAALRRGRTCAWSNNPAGAWHTRAFPKDLVSSTLLQRNTWKTQGAELRRAET